MPHHRMLIHDVMTHINDALADASTREQLRAAQSIDEAGAALPPAAAEAFGRLRAEVQVALLSVVQRTARDDRPVHLTWRHGMRQSIEISIPDQPELPVDIVISSRYTEDAGPPVGTT